MIPLDSCFANPLTPLPGSACKRFQVGLNSLEHDSTLTTTRRFPPVYIQQKISEPAGAVHLAPQRQGTPVPTQANLLKASSSPTDRPRQAGGEVSRTKGEYWHAVITGIHDNIAGLALHEGEGRVKQDRHIPHSRKYGVGYRGMALLFGVTSLFTGYTIS